MINNSTNSTIFINSKTKGYFMKLNPVLLSLIFGIIFVSFVQATSDSSPGNPLYSFKQNNGSIFSYPCFYNNTWCSGSTICRLTITNNGNVLIDNKTMENHYTLQKYNLTKQDNALNGKYKTDIVCEDTHGNGQETVWYEVTPTGSGNIRQDYFLPIILFIISICILVAAVSLNNEYVGFISGMLMTVTGAYILIYGFGDFSSAYTQMISYVVIGLGILIFIAAAYEAITSNRISLFSNDEVDDD